MIKRLLVLLILAAIVAAGFGYVWLRFTALKPGELAEFQDGDLVFQTRNSSQALPIIIATQSLYTHVGIVKQVAKFGPLIVEATNPVRETPMDEWLRQGIGSRVTVKRMRGMIPATATRILEAARPYYGKPDDSLFRFDNENIYGSELVFAAYQAGARVNLGRVQRVMELNLDNFVVRKLFELRWQNHPLCQAPPTDNYTVCADLLLRQEVMTPASIATDPKLETSYDNYGWLLRLADAEKR